MKRLKFKINLEKNEIRRMPDELLLLNVYLTQFLTFLAGIILIVWIQNRNPFLLLNWPNGGHVWGWGAAFAVAVVAVDILLSRWLPDRLVDDGGVNEKIFKNRPVWHIAVLCLIVAVCEELLFRGAIQHMIGPYWTSVLFAAVHVRYLKHWIPTGVVFATSYGLGWIYLQTGSLWTPVFAHFLIDFILGCAIKWKGVRP